MASSLEEMTDLEVRVREPRVAGRLRPEVEVRVLSRRFMGDQVTAVIRRHADFAWLHSSLTAEHGEVTKPE